MFLMVINMLRPYDLCFRVYMYIDSTPSSPCSLWINFNWFKRISFRNGALNECHIVVLFDGLPLGGLSDSFLKKLIIEPCETCQYMPIVPTSSGGSNGLSGLYFVEIFYNFIKCTCSCHTFTFRPFNSCIQVFFVEK